MCSAYRSLVLSGLVISCLSVAVPAMAATPSPQDELRRLEQALKDEKQNSASYEKAAAEAERLIKKLQSDMVEQTKILQDTEKRWLEVEERHTATLEASRNLETELKSQHARLAELLMAAQRLQRVPPEALLLRPGRPIDAARAHLLLERSTPDIANQTLAIKEDIARLAQMRADLEDQQAELTTLKTKQKKQQAKWTTALKKRQGLLAATTAKAEKSEKSIAAMNKQAADLRGILADLARQQAMAKAAVTPRATTQSPHEPAPVAKGKHWGQSLMSFFGGSRKGPRQLPIVGTIRTGYAEKLASGAQSQGLSIAGTPGGVVVAPAGGTIRFAGPFRQYRLLVIIEHAGGYHSLLGGLGEVYTKVGQSVAAGEPVGKLNGDATHANLYYEVRQNGKPIDPRQSLRG